MPEVTPAEIRTAVAHSAQEPTEATQERLNAAPERRRNLRPLGRGGCQIYAENEKQHGAATWYDWSINNWGTKWNAYSFREYDGLREFSFDTAWSPPIGILDALAEKLSDHEIVVGSCEEGNGIYALFVLSKGELHYYDMNNSDCLFYHAVTGCNPTEWDEKTDDFVEVSVDYPMSLSAYARNHGYIR